MARRALIPGDKFDPDCTACPRLARHLVQVRRDYPDYYARPVPAFGDPRARLLIVGLAPGMHGANRSGRPFTGDHAGILLYATLHKFGFASRPQSVACDDGLTLQDCRITNAVKCLPPANKPSTREMQTCNRYLKYELERLPAASVILALGAVAHQATLRALALKPSAYRFSHGATHVLPGIGHLIDSYHCSRYNTQTRRLTPPMFEQVFRRVTKILSRPQ